MELIEKMMTSLEEVKSQLESNTGKNVSTIDLLIFLFFYFLIFLFSYFLIFNFLD
jgi:hypothetical protein